ARFLPIREQPFATHKRPKFRSATKRRRSLIIEVVQDRPQLRSPSPEQTRRARVIVHLDEHEQGNVQIGVAAINGGKNCGARRWWTDARAPADIAFVDGTGPGFHRRYQASIGLIESARLIAFAFEGQDLKEIQ